MAIGIECDDNAAMLKPFAHYLGMYAFPEHERGMSVSQIVEPDPLQPDGFCQSLKGPCYVIRAKWFAFWA